MADTPDRDDSVAGPAPAPHFVQDGIESARWYDSDQFCARLGIAKNRRQALNRELRGEKDVISNGYSFIAQASTLLDALRRVAD